MNIFRLLLIGLVIISSRLTHAQETVTSKVAKPQLAFLGTFHFAGSNDMLSMKIDDLLSDKRQKEMLDMIEQIKKFQPTKVILEYPYGKTKLDSIYQEYLKGNHKLTINERQQIGFRLAKGLGHEHIYAADHHANLPFDQLIKFIEETNQMDDFNALIANMKRNDIEPLEQFYSTHDLTTFFIHSNREKMDADNRLAYLQYLLKYVSEDNKVGVQMATDWWGRNFQIMSNIDQLVKPDDRVFVLFGQGHTALLKQFYADRNDVELVDIVKYLE